MSRLKVKLRGTVLAEVHLENDRQYIAGRKEDCDIRLQPEKGISREHFKVSFIDGIWQVDLLARFGDIINQGTKVNTLKLQHGTQFSVPPYDFEYLEGAAEIARPKPAAGPKVAVSATTDMQSIPQFNSDIPGGTQNQDGLAPISELQVDNAPALGMNSDSNSAEQGAPSEADAQANEKTIVGVAPSVPYLKVMGKDGMPKEMLRLEGGNSWVAGRDSTCSIQIKDTRVSRRQFEIRKISGQYFIIDLGSVNGTLLNGTPISSSDPNPVKSGDAILVLDNLYYFELHDPGFKHRLDAAYVPPPPPPDHSAGSLSSGSDQSGVSSISQLLGERPNTQVLEASKILQAVPDLPNVFSENAEDRMQPSGGPIEIPEIEMPDHQQPSMEAPAGASYSGGVAQNQMPQTYQGNLGAPPYDPTQAPAQNYQGFQPQPGFGGIPGMDDLNVAKPPGKAKKNVIRILFSLILLGVIGFIGYQEFFEKKEDKKTGTGGSAGTGQGENFKPLTPFDALAAADKSKVEEFWKQAENLCSQAKYHECRERLDNIHSILPEGYLDSKRRLQDAIGAIDAEEFARKEDERIKAIEEDKKFIEKEVANCRKLITPRVTLAEVESCLSEADRRNPTSPDVVSLKTEASNIESDRKLRDEEKERNASLVKVLEKKFQEAEDVQRSGLAFKAMEAYKKVINTKDLPDPKHLREKSEERIEQIRAKIDIRTKDRIEEAEKSYKEGQIKDAILSLREALYFDPSNKVVKEKIEQYMSELSNLLKQIYTEAMLEEHFGNVEGTDGRPGAIEKLDEIVKRDVKDGEYYRKAMTKLLNLQRRKPSAN